jgi:serine/threonine protein phosphatase PrpC
MESAYLHVEVTTQQTPKRAGQVCGDQVGTHRSRYATTVILCDGIGSGLKANLAARMLVSRLTELLDRGVSLRRAFARCVETTEQHKTRGTTYAAFSVASILPDGAATVLSYEAPGAIHLASNGVAAPVDTRSETVGRAMVQEGMVKLGSGDGLLLVSDGVTQAGLGGSRPRGWGVGDVATFVQRQRRTGLSADELPAAVHRQAMEYWGHAGDDITACLLRLRPGRTLNLLTGPPTDKRQDRVVVQRFLERSGEKVVCGGTTASVVAGASGREVRVDRDSRDTLAPPASRIEGVDLVTEGAVTLNQVANLLDVEPEELPREGPVAELVRKLLAADRVRVLVGLARNPAAGDVSLKQLGVLQRETIVNRIAETIRTKGKLVTIETV